MDRYEQALSLNCPSCKALPGGNCVWMESHSDSLDYGGRMPLHKSRYELAVRVYDRTPIPGVVQQLPPAPSDFPILLVIVVMQFAALVLLAGLYFRGTR